MAVIIASVEPGSPAQRAGVAAGMGLISINGQPIRDVLDYRFYMTDPLLDLRLETEQGPKEVRVRKAEYDDLGLAFDTYLMDRQHHCRNKCIFCFVDQLPRGLRDTLYFKDDDSRMSFLFGSYVTLTNQTEEDIRRIIKMHISPINISVHTTNPRLRVEMLGNPRSGEVLDYIPMLTEAGIQVNTQLVLCPGVNDGPELRRSLHDLARYAPNLQSIALVPVGLTCHRDGLHPLRPLTGDEARDILDLSEEFNRELVENGGRRLAFAADELVYSATLRQWMTHSGIDIAASKGTEVYAVWGGTVDAVYEDDALGVTVEISHSDGLRTTYANLAAEPPVKEGQRVNANAPIGQIGATALAECADPSHLHFEIHKDGKAVDPLDYVLLIEG